MGFIITFILLVIAAHGYVFWHLWYILPLSPIIKTVVLSLMTLSFLCLFLYLSPVQDKMPMVLARIIYETGTSWIIILLYLFMVFLLVDILRLCHIMPKTWIHSSVPGSLGLLLLMFVIFFCGNVRYHHKQRKTMDLQTSKSMSKPQKFLFVSDLHLGYHNPRSEFARWVELLNSEESDAIFIAGDIIDGNLRPLLDSNYIDVFKTVNAPIYACLGNHEYLAGRDKSIEFYKSSGIHLLVDSMIVLDDFCVIGRDDRSNKHRKSLKELCIGRPSGKYTILLDHQPYSLEETSSLHIDLQLSGHTHHGQVWPLNWITDLLYECAYGPYKKDSTDYYISSGLGIWGGKFRIGTCSEYVVISID